MKNDPRRRALDLGDLGNDEKPHPRIARAAWRRARTPKERAVALGMMDDKTRITFIQRHLGDQVSGEPIRRETPGEAELRKAAHLRGYQAIRAEVWKNRGGWVFGGRKCGVETCAQSPGLCVDWSPSCEE